MPEMPMPSEGIVLTHFIVSADVPRSAAFYADVLGGEVVMEGEPTVVQLANGWVIINVGGGPTEDKPDVVLEVPSEPNRVSAFLNIRVADIERCYEEWSAKGADFLTPPQHHFVDGMQSLQEYGVATEPNVCINHGTTFQRERELGDILLRRNPSFGYCRGSRPQECRQQALNAAPQVYLDKYPTARMAGM